MIASFITYPPLARLTAVSIFLFSLGLYGLWATEQTEIVKKKKKA